MKFQSSVPLIVPNVGITGPRGFICADLILDTGAVLTVLSSPVLRFAGYDPSGSELTHRVLTANGTIEAPKLVVAKMTVGDAVAHDVDVLCWNISGLKEASGLLGLSFLKYFRTVVDYRSGYCEIS